MLPRTNENETRIAESSTQPPTSGENTRKVGWLGLFVAILISSGKWLLALGKVLLPALKLLKLGKILVTSGSMLVSIWFYALLFGWPFAVGFVLSIFVHEMGHVYVAWRQGLRVSAPIFIPGMGALILAKESRSQWAGAIMGIGGPVGGTIGALFCWYLFFVTQNRLFLALAYTGFFINLFNMVPIFPFDGGRIVAAISAKLWLVGLIVMVAMFIAGWIRNPLILILLILSIPSIWRGFRSGKISEDSVPATSEQKMIMGVCYVGLALFLAFCMGETFFVVQS